MKTYLTLTIAMIIWGLSFVATKIALTTIPALTLIFARYGLAAVLVAVFMAVSGFPRLPIRAHAQIFLTAVLDPGLYFFLETVGLQYTTASKASLIVATIPITVTVMAAMFLGERPGRAMVWSIIFSFAGVLFLAFGDPKFTGRLEGPLVGDVLLFCGVLVASVYMILLRIMGRSVAASSITCLQILYGALLYFPFFLWEFPDIIWSDISAPSIGAWLFLTLFATVGALAFYNSALTRVEASRVSLFINFIPVVTVFGAWMALGETLSFFQAVGGGLVLAAMSLGNVRVFRSSHRNIEHSTA